MVFFKHKIWDWRIYYTPNVSTLYKCTTLFRDFFCIVNVIVKHVWTVGCINKLNRSNEYQVSYLYLIKATITDILVLSCYCMVKSLQSRFVLTSFFVTLQWVPGETRKTYFITGYLYSTTHLLVFALLSYYVFIKTCFLEHMQILYKYV
jgi:hypothetical protein